MAADPFNSLSGYSVGIPAVSVIDSNGNVVSNFLNLSGNVSANTVYANYYYFANGQPFTPSAGGLNTELQFNNNGVLGGIPDVTYDGNILSLGDISTLSIGGGLNGYFLQTDGAGNLTWAAGGNGGGGNGNPGGANTQIQFNDAGVFGGDAGFTYNKVTNTLHVENISAGDTAGDSVNIIGNLSVTGNISLSTDMTVGNSLTIENSAILIVDGIFNSTNSSNVSLGNISNLHIDGGTYGQMLSTDGLGNLFWSSAGNGNGNPGGISQSVQFNDAGAFAGESVFVYDQVLNRLSVPSIKSNVSANFVGASSVNLGSVSNVKISGGFNGYVLTTDGSGNLSWSAGGGGGNGVPGGSNTQVQFNDNGAFGGTAFFTFNNVTNTVQVGGNLIANSFQMGSGAYKWSTSLVYFASTASSAAQQVLYSIPVSEISGVEFEIIATEPAGPSRQSSKISSLYYNGTVQYTEYASLFVNGGVGNFEVDYNGGNIVVPPALELKISPNTSNPVTYKMLITQYAP